ncbi:Rho-type gtpase-activating protein [Sporothrix bragantina]|uniref:Rho-type gtpase-activating protein n=1 Tax=Sporothrix bragantina TaxID=671064 RepID=A0ABP0C715_9PEZI
MAAMDEYLDNTMEADDIFPCKGCGEILEEGKAFELAGHRWHLNCFRCNSCGTLLDSDANLLLLGDGSLICNNCTYSCSACGNKIEDLAILTGEQAFCATCFRCRNCKRKIENLRYARTSQGIFCMSCHESLMARRRKKHKAAAQAKAREKDGSPMITDKSLPALPPATPTELSPRPRPPYPRNESSSLSASVRPDRSPERSSIEVTSSSTRDSLSGGKPSLTLPASSYRNNRNSAVFGGTIDLGASDSESFYIPVALDPSPGITPRSVSDSLSSDPKKGKEKLDYFSETKAGDSQASTPHIAFQEKVIPPGGSVPTPDYDSSGTTSKDLLSRKLSKSSRTDRSLISSGASSAGEDHKHVSSSSRGEEFKLQEAPKSKKSTASSRTNSQAATSLGSALEFDTPKAPRRDRNSAISPPVSTSNSSIGGRSSQDARLTQDDDEYLDSSGLTTPTSRPSQSGEQHVRSGPIARKELPSSARTVNGKPISSPLGKASPADEIPQPTLAPPPVPRPNMAEHKLSDTYMQPRAPPQPPSAPAPPPAPFQTPSKESVASNNVPGSDPQSPPKGPSPKLPRWSAGGDFSMDEDMARILGTDESSSSILRRVSNAVRHGRNSSAESSNLNHGNGISPRGHNRSVSETTRATASPRWPKTPIVEDSGAHDISSPISLAGGTGQEDPAMLKRRLRNSEQRVAELERQFGAEKDLKSLNKKLLEKRRTVSVLDTQAEIMIRQLEVLAGYVERAKTTKQPIDAKELEDSAIKDFVQRLDELQKTMATTIEQLHAERDALVEEKNQAVADRDRALLEFEQLSSKNAQLADMNNDLTHQIQERFKSQIGTEQIKSPNGLGIYHSHKGPSISSMNMDAASIQTSTNATLVGTDGEEPIVESGPTVVNIRKGQVRKFNWKKGSKTVAQNLTKGVNRAVGAFQNDREQQRGGYQGLTGDSIGLPYNMTVASVDSPTAFGAQAVQIANRGPGEYGSTGSGVGGAGGAGSRGISGPISGPMGPGAVPGSAGGPNNANGGFGFFKKSNVPKSGTATSLMNSAPPAAEAPSTLFGSDLVERADYERRQIPSVVTRCIEEVELRGMDVEGIYRKTGGNSQVKAIQEGFEKQEDYDISDPGLDITAVTSVLKQYFRKLPNPLLTFEVYDGVLESTSITDTTERCDHLRKTFKLLPVKHHDCLEFLMFHLSRVAQRERENLMSPKNLAVVFAPTILHTQNLEREMSDMHAKNLSIQFVIENSHTIFSEA